MVVSLAKSVLYLSDYWPHASEIVYSNTEAGVLLRAGHLAQPGTLSVTLHCLIFTAPVPQHWEADAAHVTPARSSRRLMDALVQKLERQPDAGKLSYCEGTHSSSRRCEGG